MVTSFFKHERIRTTDAKAKALRGWAEHIITLAKRGDLHARRQAMSIIREKQVVHKLFENAEKRFGKLSGGYTRVVKLGCRPGDAAPMSLIEIVDAEQVTKKIKKPKADKTALPHEAPMTQPEAETQADNKAEEPAASVAQDEKITADKSQARDEAQDDVSETEEDVVLASPDDGLAEKEAVEEDKTKSPDESK
jgi:large subunit ribosomal protein L17